jgi:hypothetical protein
VYVEGIAEPVVASRSEAAIARDVALALGGRLTRGGRDDIASAGQEPLF